MKTFDEAFAVVCKNADKSLENMQSSIVERHANKAWVGLILHEAGQALKDFNDPTLSDIKVLDVLAHQLHGIFEMGLLTGMEMEKDTSLAQRIGMS